MGKFSWTSTDHPDNPPADHPRPWVGHPRTRTMELQTVKMVGTHTLKIIVPDSAPQERFCIGSELAKGYSFVNGQLLGEQHITICRNYARCILPGRASVCKCGCYLYMVRMSPECCYAQHSNLFEGSTSNAI